MNKDHVFLKQYNAQIAFTLECFDRVIFKGYLQQLCYPEGVRKFVDYTLRIKRKDFMPWAKRQSERIVAHAEQLAKSQRRPYEYLRGHQRKEAVAAGFLRTHPVAEGLVCVLRCLEHCPSFPLVQAKGRPDFAPARPPALVFYFYYLDPQLSLIHIRVPTLVPWTIQIAVLNGFVNRDVRQQLFPAAAIDPGQRRRASAATGRLLKRLHVRGLLLKVPHSRRWHVSPRGRNLFTELLRAHHALLNPLPHARAA